MKASKLTPKILFEDESILVLEKPAGLVVNKVASVRRETLEDWLEKKLSGDKGFLERSGIIHRLDKETSGVMVAAKTPSAVEALKAQFKNRRVRKVYLALTHGTLVPSKGEIKAPVSRSSFDRKKFGVFLGGRPAKTGYQKIGDYQNEKAEAFSLLEVYPATGRTHQIRVHLKHLGYPVVGDEKYAGRKTARADRRWCPRQFLHAHRLGFFHPQTGKRLEFKSPLPEDLKKVLDQLTGE